MKNGLKVKILGGTGGAYSQERGGIFPDITIKNNTRPFNKSTPSFLLRYTEVYSKDQKPKKIKGFF